MRKQLNRILKKVGLTLYSKKLIKYYSTSELKKMFNLDEYDISYIRGKLDIGLKEKLLSENKNKWLDIGCGGNFEENFYYIDTFPETVVCNKDKYFRADITNITEDNLEKIGKFDLARMQHVFEHFTPEEGVIVLENISKLLNKDGYLLITTPDLKRFAYLYLSGKISENFDWAYSRIEKKSPDSFYFSVFSHSILTEQHKWCYDFEGLKYQLLKTGKYKNIEEITLEHELASIPFTHNRPDQDVCVLAQLK